MYKEFQTFKPFQKFQSLKRYAEPVLSPSTLLRINSAEGFNSPSLHPPGCENLFMVREPHHERISGTQFQALSRSS